MQSCLISTFSRFSRGNEYKQHTDIGTLSDQIVIWTTAKMNNKKHYKILVVGN